MNMFTFGIILVCIGLISRVYARISSVYYAKSLAPQNILLHNSHINEIKQVKKQRLTDAGILIVVGIVLILTTGVFN